MKNGLRIMIVEDEGIVAFDLRRTLERMGHRVISLASSGIDAIEKAEIEHPDLILMDVKLKDQLDGIDTAKIISFKQRVPIIYLTSYNSDEVRKRAKTTAASAFLIKPFDETELKTTIDNISFAEIN